MALPTPGEELTLSESRTLNHHQDGLRRELERIAEKTNIEAYATLIPKGDELAGWHANLREHTRRLDLPSLLDSHARVSADHHQMILAAKRMLEFLEAKIISELSADVRFFPWAEFIHEELVNRASKGDRLWDPDERQYKQSSPDGNGQVEFRWGEYSLTHAGGPEHFDRVVSAHKKIRCVASRMFPYLKTSAKKATSEARDVRVEVLRLQRMPLIPGDCSECRPPA